MTFKSGQRVETGAMSAPTPGPWTLYSNSPDADGTEALPSIMARNPLGDGLFYVAQANRIEDALLIAAAPEMLEALRMADKWEADGRPDGVMLMIARLRVALEHYEGTL